MAKKMQNFLHEQEIKMVKKKPEVLFEIIDSLFQKIMGIISDYVKEKNDFQSDFTDEQQQQQQSFSQVSANKNDNNQVYENYKKMLTLEQEYRKKLQEIQKQKIQMTCLESRVKSLTSALEESDNKQTQLRQQLLKIQQTNQNYQLNLINKQSQDQVQLVQNQVSGNVHKNNNSSFFQNNNSSKNFTQNLLQAIQKNQKQYKNSEQQKSDDNQQMETELNGISKVQRSLTQNPSQISQKKNCTTNNFGTSSKKNLQQTVQFSDQGETFLTAEQFNNLKNTITTNTFQSNTQASKKHMLEQYNQKLVKIRHAHDEIYRRDIVTLKQRINNLQKSEEFQRNQNHQLLKTTQIMKKNMDEAEKKRFESEALNPLKNRSLTTYFDKKLKEKDKIIENQKKYLRKNNVIQKKQYVLTQNWEREKQELNNEIFDNKDKIKKLQNIIHQNINEDEVSLAFPQKNIKKFSYSTQKIKSNNMQPNTTQTQKFMQQQGNQFVNINATQQQQNTQVSFFKNTQNY
ncbi:hypothetical protein PPERSA_12570 [Pseudocohnilembus persalinus]|uniref:Uncharacterized protein n=1 Tax=Pseudocohnilembus persalinus TaxID=266149 RepID=A0A0V0QCC0_PSEPJ|nr:hypothetical protein PPERSA_12570 [Pseudocohnilembus persalinus]|eukprot:KRW99894.1 hypothetical protein PPERSA_12570 [Pseudocohnilembus persalinus]